MASTSHRWSLSIQFYRLGASKLLNYSQCHRLMLPTAHLAGRVIGRAEQAQLRAASRGTGWAHFGHTHCPQRSILVNHNGCHFAAQCRFRSETSTPKRVRFPAAPQEETGQDESPGPIRLNAHPSPRSRPATCCATAHRPACLAAHARRASSHRRGPRPHRPRCRRAPGGRHRTARFWGSR
jgi:hypothetical protein